MRILRRGDWLNPRADVAAVVLVRRTGCWVRRGGCLARRGDCFAGSMRCFSGSMRCFVGSMRCFVGGGDSIVLGYDNSTIRRTLCFFLQKINYHLIRISYFKRIFA